jgi:hypothetical protein
VALVLCASVIMMIGLLCVLAATYIGLSSAIGVTYGLLATGGIGMLLALLVWWIADRVGP